VRHYLLSVIQCAGHHVDNSVARDLVEGLVELVDITSCILIRTFGVSILVPRVVVRCSSCSSCISIYFTY
jgi:hypothetical protein